MAVLALSEPQDVNIISFSSAALKKSFNLPRASFIAFDDFLLKSYILEGFAYSSLKYGIISSKTFSSTLVVALLSKYISLFIYFTSITLISSPNAFCRVDSTNTLSVIVEFLHPEHIPFSFT